MAERHTIFVRVKDGEVSEVLFCDCCPDVTLEVRTYATQVAALAMLESSQSHFECDELGVYETTYYEPDADNE
jgi:hypothetical protein